MRILITGGRMFGRIPDDVKPGTPEWDIENARAIAEALLLKEKMEEIDARTPIEHLFHGNAKGADRLASSWAVARNAVKHGVPRISIHACPADWKKYGKRAGPIRNQTMLGHRPDLVVAFKGNAGTADCVRRARAAGIEVLEVE